MKPAWRVEAAFDSGTRRFDPEAELVDPDGFTLADPDGVPVIGIAGMPIKPADVDGAKSFDTLVTTGAIDVNYYTLTTTIASGSSLSAVIEANSRPLLAFVIPSGWTDADLTFQVSLDGLTYAELIGEDGNAITLEARAGQVTRLADPSQWEGWPYLKVRSGTSGSPVTQAATRTITVRVKDA